MNRQGYYSLPIYDRLVKRLEDEKYRQYDLVEESRKISTVLRKMDPKDAETLAGIIYALILHHDNISHKGSSFRKIPFDGKVGSRDTNLSIHYVMTNLPPELQQIIILFINEVISDTCPEAI